MRRHQLGGKNTTARASKFGDDRKQKGLIAMGRGGRGRNRLTNSSAGRGEGGGRKRSPGSTRPPLVI